MPRASAFDANGAPRSGSKLYFYEPTTTTPKQVYSNSTLSTVISQPVVATSAGLWPAIFMQSSTYRVILKDADDVTIWDEDNYDPGLGAGFGVSSVVGIAQGGTGADNAASARSNIGAASSASLSTVQDSVTALQTAVAPGLNGGGTLGTAASHNSGTSGEAVPLLNAANTWSDLQTFTSTSGIVARNIVRAWASFGVSGTTVSFTSGNYFNIASITRTGEGTFTVAFTNNLPSANFVVVGGGTSEGASSEGSVIFVSSKAVSGFTLKTQRINTGAGDNDPAYCDFVVFGF